MFPQSLVERMARAHDREESAQRGEPDPWKIEGEDYAAFRSERITAMICALEAVREPSPEMVAAAWRKLTFGKKIAGIARLGAGQGVGEVWTALIDAMIEEAKQ